MEGYKRRQYSKQKGRKEGTFVDFFDKSHQTFFGFGSESLFPGFSEFPVGQIIESRVKSTIALLDSR
jgi:hypothetical protein